MKQLDVDVSPPAFVCQYDLCPWPMWPLTLTDELLSSNFCLGTDRQTDGQTDRQKATPKSPLCISTGGLKYIELNKQMVHRQEIPKKKAGAPPDKAKGYPS